MYGGAGNDTYTVDNVGDIIGESENDGAADLVQSSVDYTLSANVENLTFSGSGDRIGMGNASNNYLTGNSGENSLVGLDGNDTLDGGTDSDTMIGGTGDDVYYMSTSSDMIVENSNEGTDTVYSSVAYTLGENIENLVITGYVLRGTGNALDNYIVGNLYNQTLVGNGGNDTLDGGTGADEFEGGTGDDVYIVNGSGDDVVENADEGNDTVLSSITYTLGTNVEHLTLTGTGDINGVGNTSANMLTGNSGANSLVGMDGNDTLTGGAGNDTMQGNAGNDCYMIGTGDGNDVINNYHTDGLADTAAFQTGITMNNLWFSTSGNDLLVTIAGTSGNVAIKDWSSGAAYQLDKFTSGGYYLANAQVQQLVTAMASFNVDPGTLVTGIPQNIQDQLAPTLASTWQAES
jgi:Ca2+-binding RTX toxin-like protein